MPVSSFDSLIEQCLSELLHVGKCVYTASSEAELAEWLEAISLSMEERNLPFTFALEGLTVQVQLEKDS